MCKLELDKVMAINKELKKKMRTLATENSTIAEECNKLFKKKEQVDDEIKMIKYAIDTLSTDDNEIKEKIFKVEGKIY